MSKFIPDYVFDSIFDITPELLKRHGIRAALIDLDGTMVSHKTALPTDEVASFVRRLEDAGIHVVVFSNNNAQRVGRFSEPLGVDFISRAHKPFAHLADRRHRRPDLHRCVRRQPRRRTDLLRGNARPAFLLDQRPLSARTRLYRTRTAQNGGAAP